MLQSDFSPVSITSNHEHQYQQQHIRNSARSISECVEEYAAMAVDANSDADQGANDDDGDEDEEADIDDDDDDFTTLSEINEPQPHTFALTTTIDVDNLIDAIDANTTTTASNLNNDNAGKDTTTGSIEKTETAATLLTCAAAAAIGDDKSQVLSDIDNESFNSIDFDAEITIGGDAQGTVNNQSESKATEGATEVSNNASISSNDTIGSFFNNLLSHSNAGNIQYFLIYSRKQ